MTLAKPISFDAYRALPGVNWSTLRELRRSPLAYRHALTATREDTDALILGRAVHTSVLEPDRIPLEYVVWDRGRRAGGEWVAFQDANASRTILTAAQYQKALAIRDAVRGNPYAMEYLAEGEAEQVVTWTDEKTGIACKGRLDWRPRKQRRIALDLKTARNATNPRVFAADVFRLGYHCQLDMYCRGLAAQEQCEPDEFGAVIIAVEPEAPHDVVVYRLDDDAMVAASEEVDELLARLAECRAEGKWPGRFEGVQDLSLPRWAFPSDDEVLGDLAAASEAALMEG